MPESGLLLLGANQFQRERALIGAECAYPGKILTVSKVAPYINNKYPLTTIASDESQPAKLCEDVIRYLEKSGIVLEGVVPLNDFVLNAGRAVATHFNLPYHSAATIQQARHKTLMKEALANAGLPVVTTKAFHSTNEALAIAESFGYPVVVKPLDFGGSGGVTKASNPNELKEAIQHAESHLNQFCPGVDADPKQLVIEPYIVSEREVSIEVINTPSFRQVIGITDKHLSPEPYFSELAHTVPSNLYNDKAMVKHLEQVAIDACDALDIQYGMAHVEAKVTTDQQVVLIEIGARTAGGSIMDLYEKAMGVNLYQLHCQSYLGQLERADIPTAFLNTAAIGYLHPKPGVISAINNALPDTLPPAVDSIVIKTQPGTDVKSAQDWSTRNGFVEYILWQHQGRATFDVIASTKKLSDTLFEMKSEMPA